MRFLNTAIPLLAGLSALAEAQDVDFSKVYAVKPQAKTIKPTTTSTSTVKTSSIASSIVSKLSSEHAATMIRSSSTVSLKKSSSTKKASVKPSSSSKKPTSSVKKSSSSVKKPLTLSTKKATTSIKKSSSKKITTSTKKSSVKVAAPSKKAPSSAKKASSKKASTSSKKITSTKRPSSTIKKTTPTKAKRATSATCTNVNTITYGYTPNPNTPTQFLLDSNLATLAAAQWYPPAGYSTSFTGQYGGLFANNYLGYQQLSSFNTSACAAYCNARDDCNAFNIYFERTPTFIPDDACPNPNAGTSVTCALWGGFVDATQATNIGQYRKDFMVVIQGSNGYNLNPSPASVSTFSGPTALDGVVNVNSINNKAVYLTQRWFSTYDVTQCSDACQTYTSSNKTAAVNSKSSTYTPCNYFNVFNLTSGGSPQAMGCYLYSTSDVAAYDTARTAVSNSVTYNLTNSYGYTLYPQDRGMTAVTWTPAPTGANASCSALGNAGDAYIDSNGKNYTLGCGYDVQYAADIGNTTTADFYSCFAICDNLATCSGFAYLGNTCYFKNLAGTTRTPQLNNYNVDMAWLPSAYAGFDAYTIPATVTFTSSTTAWASFSTSTSTIINGLSGTYLVYTYGRTTTPTGTVYVTSAVETGTASTISSTTIAPTGTTKTGTVKVFYPTPPTTCGNNGATAAGYTNIFSNKQGTAMYPAYIPESFKTMAPLFTATASYIAEYNAVSTYRAPAVTMYGTAVSAANAQIITLEHAFYLFAGHGTGYYSINIPQADDATFVWLGPHALSGWTRANAQLSQFYVQSGTKPITYAFFLTANTYTPIRINFGNGAEVGSFQVNMYAPDGTTLLSSDVNSNSGYMSPHVVRFPCDSSLGGKFSAWGSGT